MDLPSTRELELETLLREKEEQITELGDEVTRLRHHLSSQPGSSTTDPVTLPPPLVSLLLPHLHTESHLYTTQPHSSATQTDSQSQLSGSLPSGDQTASLTQTQSTGTATATGALSSGGTSTSHIALTQRVKILQEENEELYEILKRSETGRLKEEVQSLRRIVEKLEGALRESHSVILSLSTELDKSNESFISSRPSQNNSSNSKQPYPRSRSPRGNSNSHSHSSSNGSKLPPTGPRAHKKPRLSDAQSQSHHHHSHSHSSASISPHLRNNTALPSQSQTFQSSGGGGNRHKERSEHAHPSPRKNQHQNHVKSEKMDIDEDSKDTGMGNGPHNSKSRHRSPEQRRDRDYGGHRDRGRERDKNNYRDRERDKERRNGSGPGPGGIGNTGRMTGGRGDGGGGRRGGGERMERVEKAEAHEDSGDRTLAERMGL